MAPLFLVLAALLCAGEFQVPKVKFEKAPDAAARKAAPAKIDLLPQFADPKARCQKDVGSCHAFGSTAVLEAAYFRHYKEKVRFAEADLFIRRTALSPERFKKFCETGVCETPEGNDVIGDVTFAITQGVASDLEYEAFVERFRRYRAAEKKTLEGIKKAHEEQGWLVSLFYNPRKHWAELENRPANRRIYERYLTGSDGAIEKQRAANKEKLKGFRPLEKVFAYLGSAAAKLAVDQCRAQGREQGKVIVGELEKGRPVAISMSLAGLKAWGQTDASKHANHAFAVVGREGEVLKTRNSWGEGENHDVHEHELCRVYSVVTVLTPNEKP